jgi:hypothetical protein
MDSDAVITTVWLVAFTTIAFVVNSGMKDKNDGKEFNNIFI